MPAFDTPRTPRLDGATLDELRSALDIARRDGADHSRVGDALHRAANASRQLGITAEQLIVALKAEWHALERSPGEVRDPGRAELLRSVVTRCIRQYYAD